MHENSTGDCAEGRCDGPTERGEDTAPAAAEDTTKPARPKEIGGRDGPDPVRYGDWEKNGRCIDF